MPSPETPLPKRDQGASGFEPGSHRNGVSLSGLQEKSRSIAGLPRRTPGGSGFAPHSAVNTQESQHLDVGAVVVPTFRGDLNSGSALKARRFRRVLLGGEASTATDLRTVSSDYDLRVRQANSETTQVGLPKRDQGASGFEPGSHGRGVPGELASAASGFDGIEAQAGLHDLLEDPGVVASDSVAIEDLERQFNDRIERTVAPGRHAEQSTNRRLRDLPREIFHAVLNKNSGRRARGSRK